MVIISTPLSAIPVQTGVEGMEVAGPRALLAPVAPEVPLPAEEMVSLTMVEAGVGMEVVEAMAVVTVSPGSRAGRRQLIGAGRRRTEVVRRLIAEEDSVKVILTV